ncbi:hypothetical protein SEA_KABOCHA_120 [Gordonia phage Kabocha]|uniref:JAB domain-containing protein n=1 Tax=Gordonia phage Chidiebere TaxID=2656530 RepID=A0A649VLJ0_9CAUD|nr:minor tail protein [Gordonia phage Chidiebere]QGJ93005.1 hypothetical protein PBI_CHIDIEBERE_119 [Gordonia phage Chidiebere]WAA19906.1 hypothetical protein SEA_KABOCHA_120 [Gordonia phage Kabocha]WAA20095.1 hypothetical protein SEA_HANEM_118 [Gordonia phage Hanem]WNM67138.1 hypothetical protein SEA_SCHOMBER_117 [Gordonia Phage Schomber]
MFGHLDHDETFERCGLFLKDRRVVKAHHTEGERPVYYVGVVVELPNRHHDSENNFRISQNDIDRALGWLRREQDDILGFWHTHPARFLPTPSDDDLASVALGDKDWWHCVYSLDTCETTWFDYYNNMHTEEDRARRPYKRVQSRAQEYARRQPERR